MHIELINVRAALLVVKSAMAEMKIKINGR